MGYKTYGGEPARSRLAEFCEWFFAVFMTFSSCIGGWLVHFGMSVWWMLAIACVLAIAIGYKCSTPETKRDPND